MVREVLCFWIEMDMFGVVELTLMANSDSEILEVEILPRK
jgi:hypothetical protein